MSAAMPWHGRALPPRVTPLLALALLLAVATVALAADVMTGASSVPVTSTLITWSVFAPCASVTSIV